MTRLAIIAAVLLAGCVASPEDSADGHDTAVMGVGTKR